MAKEYLNICKCDCRDYNVITHGVGRPNKPINENCKFCNKKYSPITIEEKEINNVSISME